MTQLTTPPNETYAVIVPKDAKDFQINTFSPPFLITYLYGDIEDDFFDIEIPFDVTILGTVTSESIDFDVSGIVEKTHGKLWRDYSIVSGDWIVFVCSSATDSFRSLLKSKGVEIGENEKLVIIQKR